MAPIARLPATFRFAEALKAGLTKHALYRLRDQGAVLALGAGLYRLSEAEQAVDVDLIAVARRAPRATLCLTSALARHELTDTIPASLDLALPRGTRPLRTSLPVSWHFFDAKSFDVGREQLALDAETSIGLYSPERCLIDSFRMSGLIGPDLAREALRAWLRRRGSQPATLLAMARSFPRCDRAVREALEFLL
jgi:hypothetical protein